LFVAVGLLLAAGASPVHAAPVGAAFLRVGIGARTAALAESDLTGTTDASGLFWNPATLGLAERREFLLVHNRWIADVRQEFAGAVFPMAHGGLGFGVSGLYLGNIPRYEDDVPSDEPQGDFGYYALVFQGGYSRTLIESVRAGATLKAIREQIDIDGGWSAAIDVGVRAEAPIDGLSIALVMANLGTAIRIDGVASDLPLEGRAGASYVRSVGPVSAGLHGALRSTRSLNPRGHFGAEVGAHGVFLRAGLKTGYDSEDVAFGAGFVVSRARVDYAYVPLKEDLLGESHRIALAFAP
jgi:hypothetical protein